MIETMAHCVTIERWNPSLSVRRFRSSRGSGTINAVDISSETVPGCIASSGKGPTVCRRLLGTTFTTETRTSRTIRLVTLSSSVGRSTVRFIPKQRRRPERTTQTSPPLESRQRRGTPARLVAPGTASMPPGRLLSSEIRGNFHACVVGHYLRAEPPVTASTAPATAARDTEEKPESTTRSANAPLVVVHFRRTDTSRKSTAQRFAPMEQESSGK